ncbi:MAG: KOW domain-containing RNA-binding protein [Clostridia bacterium]|nr:KOW domain-containing RNA-binding protein [Clostridia bacterium]
MSIVTGSLVLATAGRDKDGIFLVLQTDGVYCYMANGRERKAENPKKKKLKHIRPVGIASEEILEKLTNGISLTNAEIRRSIRRFAEDGEPQL